MSNRDTLLVTLPINRKIDWVIYCDVTDERFHEWTTFAFDVKDSTRAHTNINGGALPWQPQVKSVGQYGILAVEL